MRWSGMPQASVQVATILVGGRPREPEADASLACDLAPATLRGARPSGRPVARARLSAGTPAWRHRPSRWAAAALVALAYDMSDVPHSG